MEETATIYVDQANITSNWHKTQVHGTGDNYNTKTEKKGKLDVYR